MNGHLKVYRSFFSHWLWEEDRTYNRSEAFLDLLQFAAFAPTKRVVAGKLISLSVGELVASERFLETRWKWSRTKVRQFLEILEKDQMLDQRKDQGQTVRILCNYKDYSGRDFEKKTSNQTAEDTTDQTREEPDKDQRRTREEPNKKKDKKVEEDKETTPKPPKGALPSVADLVEAIPSDWLPEYRESAKLWAECKQSRSIKKERIQSMRAWEMNLKRMALYPANVLRDAVETAYSANWQGWENDSTKKKLHNDQGTNGNNGQPRKASGGRNRGNLNEDADPSDFEIPS